MRADTKRFSTLYRYMLSSFLMFVIPLVVMSITMYQNTVINLKEEVISSNVTKLEQVRDIIDAQMRDMQHMAANISFDSRLTSFMVRSGGYRTVEAIEELGRYKSRGTFIYEILLYYKGDNTIYSSSGLYSINTLTRYVYRYDNWGMEQFYKDINEINKPTLRPAEYINVSYNETDRFLTYLYPTPPNSMNPYGVVMFLVRESILTNMIEDILGDFRGNAYILNENGMVLASKVNDNTVNISDITALLGGNNKAAVYDVKLNGNRYSFINKKSDVTGYNFIIIMPTDQFLGRVIRMKSLVIQIVVMLTAIGIGTAVLLSIRNYKPIKELREYICQEYPQSAKLPKSDEIDVIRNAIAYGVNYSQELLEQIKSQRPLVREQVLMKMLMGNFKDSDELNYLAECSQIKMMHQYFCVMVLSVGEMSTINLSGREEVLQTTSCFNFAGGVGYGVEMIHDGTISLIINMDEESSTTQKLLSLAKEITSVIKEHMGVIPTIGVGGIYNSIVQINRSYIEARAALEYKVISESKNIIFFNEISTTSSQVYWYPIEEQMRLTQSLKQGNKTVALETLAIMMKIIIEKETSVIMFKFICFDIVNTIIKTIREIGINNFFDEVGELLEFKTVKEFEEKLRDLILKVCDIVEAGKEMRNRHIWEKILDYIQNNYKDYGISLERISSEFNLSLYYVSRFFKAQTGYSFTEYITKLRMDEIKKQLVMTDKPIKDIVTETGYLDVSNFIRKFKHCHGITPGQYRILYTKEVN